MIKEVNQILSMDIGEIVSSPMSLTLLKVYSILYLNGGQPHSCEKSQKEYYKRLQKDGLQKAIEMENLEKNIHKLNKKGLMYVGKPFCKHFDLQKLTDQEAITLIEKGYLREDQFEVLPYPQKDPIDFDSMKKATLQSYAKDKKYPEDEWKDLRVDDLREYIKKKVE